MKWFLTNFAQGEDYIREQERMVLSFRVFHPDVPAVIVQNPLLDTDLEWGAITNYKPEYLLKVWRSFSDELGAMVWVDADARFTKELELPEFDGPWAAQKHKRWASGTMIFQNYPDPLLEAWAKQAGEGAFDEESLQWVIEESGHEPFNLPRTLTDRHCTNPYKATIVQYLASRGEVAKY